MARGRPVGDEGAQARMMASLQSILWNTFVRRRSDGREQERRTARSKGCWRFICCWSRSGSHPLSVLVESLLLDSGEGDYSHHSAGLPRFNLSFNFRLESFDECP
ncbi:hypothetical protein B296_00053986 [Ensete ventricosum]|uniref:Uncharacterized protein n=1 Tax=Ensete ventricosum TaxID=4639 RepID=A0A426XDV6_ENSVE|nr:hypothetical protein B296_00053986 [Ensete ventricosum]